MANEGTETTATDTQATGKTYHGSCHCGALRYEVKLDLSRGISRCNCSICQKTAYAGAFAKPSDLKVLSDVNAAAGTYVWGGKISTRYFCKSCGIHTFAYGHLAELGGDYASINVNTLDDVDPWTLPVVFWDGRHNNWEGGPRPQAWPVFPA